MADNCEYCGSETYEELMGDGYRTSSVIYCSNEHCPDDYQYCDRCDDQIQYEGGDPIPCGCVEVRILRGPYLLGQGWTPDPLAWLRKWHRQTYKNDFCQIFGFSREGDHTFYQVGGGLTFVTGGAPVLCEICGGDGAYDLIHYTESGPSRERMQCQECDGTGRAA